MNAEVAVVGLGRYGGGLGLARHLLKQGYHVRLFDLLPESELKEFLAELKPWKESLTCVFGPHDIDDFEGVARCYLNPAVPWEGVFANKLRAAGKNLSSDIECFLATWEKPVIALTGSNGKSTCWEMISQLLPEYAAGGNRGVSVFDMEQESKDGCLLELSSFQLERIEYDFDLSIVTTFTPDHLDQHGTLEAYRAAKERVSTFQNPDRLCVLGRGVADWPVNCRKQQLGNTFDVTPSNVIFDDGLNIEIKRFPLMGPHNRELFALAVATVREVLKDDRALTQRVTALCEKGMHALPHRQNVVADKPYRVVNDSKATTPESTICAIEAFTEDGGTLHLICGGKEKGVGVEGIVQSLSKVPHELYVIGEQETRWKTAKAPYHDAKNLPNAMKMIQDRVEEGDTVLLSPGTSSFGEFKNYKERGEVFEKLAAFFLQGASH